MESWYAKAVYILKKVNDDLTAFASFWHLCDEKKIILLMKRYNRHFRKRDEEPDKGVGNTICNDRMAQNHLDSDQENENLFFHG